MCCTILATKTQSKSDVFLAKKVFNRIQLRRLKHANWEVKAYKLDCKSMQIADLFDVNVTKDSDRKALNT